MMIFGGSVDARDESDRYPSARRRGTRLRDAWIEDPGGIERGFNSLKFAMTFIAPGCVDK
jgi:hypothetical protein